MTAPKYEHITYRVEWVFKIGTIGDSEGRTWAKDLIERTPFPTLDAAQAYRDAHPDLELSQWGRWKTKNCHGQFAILREEVRADAPELVALVEALEKALNFIANTESEMGETLPSGDAARAALAAYKGLK